MTSRKFQAGIAVLVLFGLAGCGAEAPKAPIQTPQVVPELPAPAPLGYALECRMRVFDRTQVSFADVWESAGFRNETARAAILAERSWCADDKNDFRAARAVALFTNPYHEEILADYQVDAKLKRFAFILSRRVTGPGISQEPLMEPLEIITDRYQSEIRELDEYYVTTKCFIADACRTN